MAGKVATPKKKTAPRKITNGDSLICEVCGLSVVVEEIGGTALEESSVLLCCGKPMVEKKIKPKAKAKK
jgi:hypothetical protein